MPEDKLEKKSDDKDEAIEKKSLPAALKWTLIVVAVIISVIGSYTLTKFVIWPKYQEYQANKGITKQNDPGTMGLIHKLDEITVNAMASNGRRFIIAEYAIETSDKSIIKEIELREPQIQDELIKYLRLRTADQILQPTFQERSKKALMTLINNTLNEGKIDSLYYVKLILQ